MNSRTLAARWAAAGWLEAAGEIWSAVRARSGDPDARAEAALSLGRLAEARGLYHHARVWFKESPAIWSRTSESPLSTEAEAHLGLVFARLGRHRDALRLLGPLRLRGGPDWDAGRIRLAVEVARLKIDQGWPAAAIPELEAALAESADPVYMRFRTTLLTQLGILRLAHGRTAHARELFQLALESSGPEAMAAANELTRLEMRAGNPDRALTYTGALAEDVWHRWMGLDKWSMANLIELMGRHAQAAGDRVLASRLRDQARALYGHIGAWRAWKLIGDEPADPARPRSRFPGRESLMRFSFVLDGVLAQELDHPASAARMDARNHVAQSLARALGWSADQRRALALVVRLADCGLMAMEPEVAEAPDRSENTWARFIGHPELG